ncbi:MAG: hypothetical protein ACLUD9_03305 [Anaerotignum faecicola]
MGMDIDTCVHVDIWCRCSLLAAKNDGQENFTDRLVEQSHARVVC